MYCNPESLAHPSRDQSAYALDPLQVPELMVGRVLLTWHASKLGNAVGKVKKDCIDGDDLEVPQVKLSLTATVAALRAQHFSSFEKIPNSDPESANPPHSPRRPYPSLLVLRRAFRNRDKVLIAMFPRPHQPAKRGRAKQVAAPQPPESEAQPSQGTDSGPGPFDVFPAKAYPEYPKIDPASIVRSQVRTAVADQNPGSITGLIKRLNRSQLTDTLAGLPARTSQVELARSTTARLALPRLASNANKAKRATPTDAASGFAAPSPRRFVAHSPVGPASATSPAVSATAALYTAPLSNVGVRKRKADDGEMVEMDAGKVKRPRLEVGDPRSRTDAGP
ncbi:hypothetical protein BN14_09911 [Rhizoctonia solani AG-1 IB]|uniref:Uncharacterized protein n=1 Tax=Thanatephorus cucumeris (strain AG1-IB / isolate 7/3/14) TaxID=1108050 RepID=M5C8L4_THACB|nr:hypothetical protein BN14_09911 [Rhizoctonia solani AG-1 IB]